MYAFLIVVHIIVSFIMISVILLQAGKGAEIGAAFGGSSQTIFGSRGPGTFLSKLTVTAAVLFMLTSLSLAVMSKQRSISSGIALPKAEPLRDTGTAEAPQTAAPSAGPVAGPSASAPENPEKEHAITPAPPAQIPSAPAQAVPPKSTP